MRGATCAIFTMTLTPPQITNACTAIEFRSPPVGSASSAFYRDGRQIRSTCAASWSRRTHQAIYIGHDVDKTEQLRQCERLSIVEH